MSNRESKHFSQQGNHLLHVKGVGRGGTYVFVLPLSPFPSGIMVMEEEEGAAAQLCRALIAQTVRTRTACPSCSRSSRQ